MFHRFLSSHLNRWMWASRTCLTTGATRILVFEKGRYIVSRSHLQALSDEHSQLASRFQRRLSELPAVKRADRNCGCGSHLSPGSTDESRKWQLVSTSVALSIPQRCFLKSLACVSPVANGDESGITLNAASHDSEVDTSYR